MLNIFLVTAYADGLTRLWIVTSITRIQKIGFFIELMQCEFLFFFFFLTKIPGLIAKAALFVYVYVCLCSYLQLRVFCLKYPFYTASVFAYKRANQFILWVPCRLNYVYRSRLLRCPHYNLWRFKA